MERERGRYIAFEAICSNEMAFKELTTAIWREIYTLFGEHGTSRAGLWMMSFISQSRDRGDDSHIETQNILRYRGILRTNHRSIDTVRISLAFLTEINGKSVLINILGISGTLKGAQKNKH